MSVRGSLPSRKASVSLRASALARHRLMVGQEPKVIARHLCSAASRKRKHHALPPVGATLSMRFLTPCTRHSPRVPLGVVFFTSRSVAITRDDDLGMGTNVIRGSDPGVILPHLCHICPCMADPRIQGFGPSD